MFDFWPLFIPGASLWQAYDAILITISGYAIVYSALAMLWRIGKETAYAAVIAVSMFLSLAGAGKIIPFFGVMPVSDGSLFFPFILIAIAFAHRKFGNVSTLNIIYGALLGLLFISLGYARWFLFGVISDAPIDEYENYSAVKETADKMRDSMLAMISLFLGGTAIIIIKQWLAKSLVHPWRFFIAVGFVILFTTPIFVFITLTKNPVYSNDYWGMLFNAYLVRYSVLWPPFIYLLLCRHNCIPKAFMPFGPSEKPHPDDADFYEEQRRAP